MLQFYLSQTLAVDMQKHLAEPVAAIPGAMQWYGHRVMLLRRKCVLMMELQSRYCMVFAGLTKPDFENFPDLFVERLWREVVSICQLDDEQSARLASLALLVGERQRYQAGSNRSVQAHLRQAATDLDYMVNYQVGRLPDAIEEQFGCGVKINQSLRKYGDDKDWFVPLEEFRDFWLNMLEFEEEMRAKKERELPDNVVPFRRR
jgi:hypothetical protein